MPTDHTQCLRLFLTLLVMTATLGQWMPGCLAADNAGEPLRRQGLAEALGYREGDSVVTIPASAREIPPYCFAGIEGLRKVRYAPGSRLTSVGAFAFSECGDLEEMTLPPGVTSIGDGAFRGCRNLHSVTLPAGLRKIPREAFAYCLRLRDIELPKELTAIGPLAFLDCRALELSRLPATVTKIGNNAFGRCFSLREMTLPRNCRSLESYAFAECTGLERITMPANGAELGELIFSGCERLREIIEPSPVPPGIECESFLFEPSDSAAWSHCRVKVPLKSLDAYRKSRFWNNFDRIEGRN